MSLRRLAFSESTTLCGNPVPKTLQVPEPSVDVKTPTSVPTNSAFWREANLTSFTGVVGKSVGFGVPQLAAVQLTSVQVTPPSVVWKRWPTVSVKPLKPEKATQALFGSVSFTQIEVIAREGNGALVR